MSKKAGEKKMVAIRAQKNTEQLNSTWIKGKPEVGHIITNPGAV